MFGRRNIMDSGTIVVDGHETGTTVQCVHCGSHELVIYGSGTKRGHCTLCTGFVCGKKFCMASCIPFEARVEYQEAVAIKDIKHVLKLTKKYPLIVNAQF